MYFRQFPQITYTLDQDARRFLITDFFRRVKADAINIASSTAYDDYDIRQGETPDILADKLYNDSALYWVILIANEIIDPRWDWPLDDAVLRNFIIEKYGLANIYATHHHVNSAGYIVHSSTTPNTAVTNYDYEQTLNDAKRRISIIKPVYISNFVDNFENVIRNGN